MNIPKDKKDAAKLAKSLINTPVLNQICLLVVRGTRKERPEMISNLSEFTKIGWNYFDSVTINYSKPTSSPKNSLVPISEHAYVLYKGQISPRVSEYDSELNLWNIENGQYQRFSSKILKNLISMRYGFETRNVILSHKVSKEEIPLIEEFCSDFDMNVTLCIDNANHEKVFGG